MPFPLRHKRPIGIFEIRGGLFLVLGVHSIYELPSIFIDDSSVGRVIRLQDEDKGFGHGGRRSRQYASQAASF